MRCLCFVESYRCCWGRGPRRGNLGPEKQRGFCKVTWQFVAKPGLGPSSVATQGWKHEWGTWYPWGSMSQPLLHQTSWPIPSAASGEACWVCTLQNFRAKWSTYFILWESTYIIPFSYHFLQRGQAIIYKMRWSTCIGNHWDYLQRCLILGTYWREEAT